CGEDDQRKRNRQQRISTLLAAEAGRSTERASHHPNFQRVMVNITGTLPPPLVESQLPPTVVTFMVFSPAGTFFTSVPSTATTTADEPAWVAKSARLRRGTW